MNPSIDRLYELLPAIHRFREAEIAGRLEKGEAGYYLRDLLRVIAEQVNALDENIAQLYDDWFIETCADWVAPYIGELVGYEPVSAAGGTALESAVARRFLVPRRDVADTIRFRRRRGAASVLDDLAAAVAGWPALPVEYFRLLCWTQNLNHQYSGGERARLVSLHDANRLDLIGTAFDPFARTVDVRRISCDVSQGRYNIPSVGTQIWRLHPYSVTRTSANCLDAGKNAYTFSILGIDTPLFTKPSSCQHGNPGLSVPTPIRRRALDASIDDYYGAGKSLLIWADWAGYSSSEPLPASAIRVADLSGWVYVPPDDVLAVDPQLGRIAFPENQLPERSVRVSYHYGFSADLGGGEYDRPLTQPIGFTLYSVGEGNEFARITDALAAWKKETPEHAVIEVGDSNVYVEPIEIELGENQSLQLRAANRKRPVLRFLDWQTDQPDALAVRMSAGSRFTLDGFLITGRGLSVGGAQQPARGKARKVLVNRYENPRNEICPATVIVRHCTLVPGWTLDCDCHPETPNKESIDLRNLRARVVIEHSILGPIKVTEDEVYTDPIPLEISDSIIDAMDSDNEAIGAPSHRHAHAVATICRCTIFGVVQVHAIQLAENSIFSDCLHVARRQVGCMRFCYVPAGCRTPKRYQCQPDLVTAAARERHKGQTAAEITEAVQREAARVRPQFTSRHYGVPAYCQLARTCAVEIVRGAGDASEMGVFHDLFQPQRLDNLRARLEQFTPAGMTSGILLVN